MKKTKFLYEYLSNLDIIDSSGRIVLDEMLIVRMDEESPIELIDAWNALSDDFDDFRALLSSIGFNDFPTRISQLFEGYRGYRGGYFSNSDYRKLQNEKLVLKKRLQSNYREKFKPTYWIARYIKWILIAPYRIITLMGFDPDEFIKTPFGQVIAGIIFISYLMLIGFTAAQISEILTSI